LGIISFLVMDGYYRTSPWKVITGHPHGRLLPDIPGGA
jgi:hypothetical protein